MMATVASFLSKGKGGVAEFRRKVSSLGSLRMGRAEARV